MKRSNSGLTWIKQPHVTQFLETIAVVPAVTHEAMDALPPSRTREFVRGLLVEHGALPHRDRYLAIFGQWAREAEKRVVDPKSRDIVRRYIRWQHLRRMNQMQTVPHGTFLRSKQTTTVAIDLVNWLADQDVSLVDLQQHHLDRSPHAARGSRLRASSGFSCGSTPPPGAAQTPSAPSGTAGCGAENRPSSTRSSSSTMTALAAILKHGPVMPALFHHPVTVATHGPYAALLPFRELPCLPVKERELH
ncbi:MAG TPA: hypothetical protein PLT20_09905 [Sedimentisphaerales bacterium]|nr:hypothetical protein [Sedimentisphaerales bacterium]